MNSMKITAGLGRLEDFQRLAKAGADELFAGFVPLEWLEKYGNDVPLNRREAILQDIQLDSLGDMRILAQMKADAGVNVALTFNSPFYAASAYPMLADILCELQNTGFNDFILADPGLMVYLKNHHFCANIHVSGEAGVFNSDAVLFFRVLGASRIIFPRKISPERMAMCVSAAPELQYEAFILNEMCHYSGAFCSSLHCDFMEPMCRVDYACSACKSASSEMDMSLLGAGGCGICALQRLEAAGVGYLKIVGRGGHAELIERDIRALKQAFQMPSRLSEILQASLFPDGCSGNCYYQS